MIEWRAPKYGSVPTVGSRMCGSCGAIIGDQATHTSWHYAEWFFLSKEEEEILVDEKPGVKLSILSCPVRTPHAGHRHSPGPQEYWCDGVRKEESHGTDL